MLEEAEVTHVNTAGDIPCSGTLLIVCYILKKINHMIVQFLALH